MMNRKSTHFKLFMTVIMIVSLSLPMVYQTPQATAVGPNELTTINLYLKHEGNTDYYMNTISRDSDDSQGVLSIDWEFGWCDVNDVVEKQLLHDLYVEGTQEGGEVVQVRVNIQTTAWTGSTDVTIELWDNLQVIADVTDSLTGGIPLKPLMDAPLRNHIKTVSAWSSAW